jgi:hypothetical protein
VTLDNTSYTIWYRAEFEVIETFTMADLNPNDQWTNDFRIVKLSDRADLKTVGRWIPKGMIFEIRGETLLHSTEKGWVNE